MKIESIKDQFKNYFVAIVSLTVAIIALCYTTWREESTEKNRNIRLAAFEVLKNLGELQIIVNHAYYQPDSTLANPYLGWGHIALISDLSQLVPPPVPHASDKLVKVWGENWQSIRTSEESVNKISHEIDVARQEVLNSIMHLR